MAWSKIQGHDAIAAAFARAFARKRLAHGFLFVGPPGVGKRLFAIELGKAILCEQTSPGCEHLEACDVCDSCVQIAAGSNPDMIVVGRPQDKNEFPIELMQQVCRDFGLKSARGRGRVAVLDDADDLNEASANCFLKTLEEPPPGSVFIIIASELYQQLPTIRSRCQVVRFAPLPQDVVRRLLITQGIDASQADRLVRLSNGSPGRALALSDPALWEFRRLLLSELAKPRVDCVDLEKRFVEFVEDAGKEASAHRLRVRQVLTLLAEALHDARLLRWGVPPRTVDPQERSFLEALAARADDAKLQMALDRCLDCEMPLDRYIQASLVVEGLLDGLSRTLESPREATVARPR